MTDDTQETNGTGLAEQPEGAPQPMEDSPQNIEQTNNAALGAPQLMDSIKAFDLCEKIAAGLSQEEGFAEELRKNVPLPDAEGLASHFKDAGFNQKQIEFVEEITGVVAKTAGLAQDGIKRAQQEAMKNSFQSSLKEEYGKSGMDQAEKAVLAWCDDHGLKTDLLMYLSPEEQVSLTKRIMDRPTGPVVPNARSATGSRDNVLEDIFRARGLK